MSSARSRGNALAVLQTEYRGVIAIMAGYAPSLSCSSCMLLQLATVLPEVVRMDFIALECTRKLESMGGGAAAHAMPTDMAFAIVAYTYDLGINSATDDGSNALSAHMPMHCLSAASRWPPPQRQPVRRAQQDAAKAGSR